MGEVYLARDPKIGREVAIKVLPQSLADDKERLARFEQEAQAAGSLNHPNILAIYDVDSENGTAYVVSELLKGETLREMMGGSPMPLRKAVDYGLQAAHGLAAAHEKGIIHRDIKPENLFVTSDGRVKILDFGLAKLTESNGDGGNSDLPTRKVNTDAGAVMGTVGYMSPEQLRGSTVDARTDIFSFGTVLYEMLSGRRAFHHDSTADTISAILREDPPDLSETNGSVNPGLERVVRRCLEKNREARFHSASDLAFALDSLSGSQPATELRQSAATEHLSPQKSSSVPPWLGWAVAGLLLAGLIGLTWIYLTRSSPQPRTMRFALAAPTRSSFGDSAVISPDGRQVAFVSIAASGDTSLWIRPLDSLDARQLTGTEGASFPFWSPDGRMIGFFAANKLKKIDATGGPAQTLADVSGDPRGGSWGPDGTIIFSPSVSSPILRVAAGGGPATEVTSLDLSKAQTSHRWPSFLPDGKHFIYFGRGTQKDLQGLFVGSLDQGEPKFILHTDVRGEYAPDPNGGQGYLLFVKERALMAQSFDASKMELSGEPGMIAQEILNFPTEVGPTAHACFSVSNSGQLIYKTGGTQVTELTWFDRSGKQQETITPPGIYHEPQLSVDGKKVAIGREEGISQDLATIDLARGLITKLTFDPAPDTSSAWSPDGTQVMFSSTRNGKFELYQKLSSGAGSDELVLRTTQGNLFVDDWSRDGKYVLYEADNGPGTKFDIMVLPMTGERKPFPLVQTSFTETHSTFSPDGRWVAYVSDESGRPEVYVQSFPASGGKWQISTAGGDQPKWRPDGKELYYLAPDRNLMAVPVTPSASFDAGRPQVLFTTRMPATGITDDRNSYIPSPDGNRFLLTKLVDDLNAQPLTLVLNWASELKK
jgi:serine/threonine protein kinase